MNKEKFSKEIEQYNKYVEQKNFRQKEQIYATYNDSIKSYNRFRTAVKNKSFNEAAQELSNAAQKLAAVVEWSAKYLVFSYYDRKIKMYPDDPSVPEWEQNRNMKKNKNGSWHKMNTHDLLSVVRSVYEDAINKSGIVIDKMDNAEVRSALINGYKHDGRQPDATAYIETVEELYRFIKELIDQDCQLENIIDTYGDSWEEFFVSCGYFRPEGNRHFVLLTDCIDNVEIVKSLFRIDWDMVLDLSYEDTENNREDLYDQYITLENKRMVQKKYLCDFRRNDTLVITPQTYWIKINGKANALRDEEQILDDKHLVNRYIRQQFQTLLGAFVREYTGDIELVVLGCSEFSQSTKRILQIWGDEFLDIDKLTIHLLDCNNNEIYNAIRSNNSVELSICKFYRLTLEEVASQISANIREYNHLTRKQICIPNGFLDYDTCQVMKSVMEVVYIGIEKDKDIDTRKTRGLTFLKGLAVADWDIINDEVRAVKSA